MHKPLALLLIVFALPAVAQELPKGAIARVNTDARTDFLRGVYLTAFSPDGRLLATRSRDQVVRVWDVKSGEPTFELSAHEDRVLDVAFSPNGKQIVTASLGSGEAVCIWDAATGEQLYSIEPGGMVARFSADGDVLTVLHENLLAWYDVASGKQLDAVKFELPRNIVAAALSPNGQTIAGYIRRPTGAADTFVVVLFDVKTDEQKELAALAESPVAIHFSPDADCLAVACRRENTIHLIGLPDAARQSTVTSNEGYVQCVAFSPDGRFLAAGNWGHTVRVWELVSLDEVAKVSGHADHVCATGFSRNSAFLATGASGPEDNTAVVWDMQQLLFGGQLAEQKLSEQQLADNWEQLTKHVKQAYAAVGQFAFSPAESLEFFGKQVAVLAPESQEERITKLIHDLDAAEFNAREAAEKELIELRMLAEPLLRKTLSETDSLEVKARIKRVLEQPLAHDSLSEPERLRMHRLIHALELIGTDEARRQLKALAIGFPSSSVVRAASAAAERLSK